MSVPNPNLAASVRPEASASNAPDRPRPKGPSAKRKRIIQQTIVTEPLSPLVSPNTMNGFNTASGSGSSCHVPPSEVAKTSSRTRTRQSAAATSSGTHGTSSYSSDVVPLTVAAKDRKEKFAVTQRTLEVAGKIAELGEVQRIKCFACAEAEVKRVLALEEFMEDQARGYEPDITVDEKDKLFSPIVCFYYDPGKLGIIKGVRMTNNNYGRCSNCMTEGRGCWWPTESLAPGLQAATAMAAINGATAGSSASGALDDSSKRSSRRSKSQQAQETLKPRKATAKRKPVITAAPGSMMAIESEPMIRPIPHASSSFQRQQSPITSRPASPAGSPVHSIAQPILPVPRSPPCGMNSQDTQPNPYHFNPALDPQPEKHLQELQQSGALSDAQAVEPEAEPNSEDDETHKALAAALMFMQNQALREEYGDMGYPENEAIQDGEIGLMDGADSGVDFGLDANEQANPGGNERGYHGLSENEQENAIQVASAQEDIAPANEAPSQEENAKPSVSSPHPQISMRESSPARISDPSSVTATVEQQPPMEEDHQTTPLIQPGERGRAQESVENRNNDHAKEPVVDGAEELVVDSARSTKAQQPAEAPPDAQLTSHVRADAEDEEDHHQALSTENALKEQYSFLFAPGVDGMDVVQEATVVLGGAQHSDLTEEAAMNNGGVFEADAEEMAAVHGEATDTIAEEMAMNDGENCDTAVEDTPMNYEGASENEAGEMVIDEPQNPEPVAEPATEISMNGNEDVVTAAEEQAKHQGKASESAPEDVDMVDSKAFEAAHDNNAIDDGEVHQSFAEDQVDDKQDLVDTVATTSENQKEILEQEYMNGLSVHEGQKKPQESAPESPSSPTAFAVDTYYLDFVPETQRDPVPEEGPATLPVVVSESSEAPPVITVEAMPGALPVTASAALPPVVLVEDGIQVTVNQEVRGGEVEDEVVVLGSTVAAAETRRTGRTRRTRSTRAAAKAIKKSPSTTNKHKGRSYATPNGGHGSTFGIPSEPPEFHLTPKWLEYLPCIPKADIIIQESSVPLKQDNRNLMSLDIPGVNKAFRKCTGCTLRECPCAPLPIEPENRETDHAKYWQNSVLDSAGCLTCRICGVICSFQLDPPIYGDYATLPSPRTLDKMKLLPEDWDNRSALDGFDGEEQVDENGHDQSAVTSAPVASCDSAHASRYRQVKDEEEAASSARNATSVALSA
ncbi:hypothetical protein QFC19_002259 [Naganishia cerealis]|uniref:Uncharacterized protein n=1 Tax=Naganishia cerealis TaxID=610337 RepID=A0ACC2WAW2_9TREE|nr:hypothetical protein QFC19_002259 [Naganishia cerealis]